MHILAPIPNLIPFYKKYKKIRLEETSLVPLTLIISGMHCTVYCILICLKIFPDCLKIAKVIPLFKSGDPCDLNNYRPISILTLISQVFERVVHNRIYRFLEKFDLLCESQFGYRC